MNQETIQVFDETEEEFVRLLIVFGFKKRVAVVLISLANTRETTARALERGANLNQSDVSMAMKNLIDRGWVRVRKTDSPRGGRATKVYSLQQSFLKILNIVEKEKKEELKNQLARLRNMKETIR
jgi:predicted transcriptional regulator